MRLFPWGCQKWRGRSWRQDRSGSTAIEFSLVAIPFVIMMLGIIEIAILYTAGSLLEPHGSEAAQNAHDTREDPSAAARRDEEPSGERDDQDH
ncbi:MAG TPA: pilus assembly protein, partial [Alphaproteobacteria bacterium]|nr:pilus assembly protein [Alphaproteobacteria bacterium]